LGPKASFPPYSPKPEAITILKWSWLKERNTIYIAVISQLIAIK